MEKLKIFFRAFYDGFKSFGQMVSTIVNFILLFFVYLVAVGSTSIVAKLFRKKFLELKLNEKKKSYWIDYNLKKQQKEEYERGF